MKFKMKYDLKSGDRFGDLTVVRRVPNVGHNVAWECDCLCGKKTIVTSGNLVGENTKSCGCWLRRPSHRRTHGMAGTPLFRIWAAMRNRCNNANVKCYPRYGGRGITVCERWNKSFADFYADMGPRPDGATLERIDNDGPYSTDNCRWATPVEQGANQRSNRFLVFHGERKTVTQWARTLGINAGKIHRRIVRDGWSVERALTTP